MRPAPISLLIASLLAAPAARAVGPTRPEPPPAAAEDEPPPGSAADQALWRRVQAVNDRIPLSRATATRLQARARGFGLGDRLDALARTSDPAAEAARAARDRLLARWSAVIELLLAPWPVDPTRGCQNEQLLLDSALRAGAGASARELEQAREGVRSCATRAERATGALDRANAELAEAIGRADAVLVQSDAAPLALERR